MRQILCAAALLIALWPPPAAAQEGRPPGTAVRFTLDPVMTKGPVTAPVTIVEFSDYQ